MSEEEGEIGSEPEQLPITKKAVSEETKELVKQSFRKPLSTTSRREIWGRVPALDLAETRCPRLDSLAVQDTGVQVLREPSRWTQPAKVWQPHCSMELKGRTEREETPTGTLFTQDHCMGPEWLLFPTPPDNETTSSLSLRGRDRPGKKGDGEIQRLHPREAHVEGLFLQHYYS